MSLPSSFVNNLKKTKTVSGTYHIAATLCSPDWGHSDTVQFLTHGIGFDRSYWDNSFNNHNYSYTQVANDKYGYSTFSWDRLGIGASQHGEPVNEIQAMLEVEAIHALTVLLRQGKISGCEKAFKKVVHIGHSFGSVQSYALTVKYPTDSDGLGLTGFSQNATYIPYFGLGGNFVQANLNPALKGYVDGYLAAGDASAVQTNFFAPDQFDPKFLAYATKTGQPVTIGELLTIGIVSQPINKFAGPVLIITGERDIPFCGGNCAIPVPPYPNVVAAAQKTLPNAKNFKAVLVPKAGHGLNYDYSHPYTYQSINGYFAKYVPA